MSAPAAPDADVRTRAADGTGAPETGSADPDRVRTAGTIGDTESSGPAAGTLPAIQALLASGREADAVAALERFLEENPESPESEEALFRLAELYEKNTSVRDLKKSVSCYDRLLERYPFTPFRERAEARRTYLIRHFFEIR